jgi:hypothetical protein
MRNGIDFDSHNNLGTVAAGRMSQRHSQDYLTAYEYLAKADHHTFTES